MNANPAHAFDIKSARLNLLAVRLKSPRLDELELDLRTRFANGSPFDGEPVVFDLPADGATAIRYDELVSLYARYGLKAVGVRGAPSGLRGALAQAGLIAFSGSDSDDEPHAQPPVQAEAPVAAAPSAPPATLIIDRPVRAGQQIYAKGGSLVVLAMVSAGAIADGDIHVYAPLRGKALAGARGNVAARIFVQAMEAELLSIAGIYRTIEQALPASIAGKPTQIFLDADKLVMQPLAA
ncbi:MAG: septum site-determining protein MinC [Microvirgula sp.]